MIFYLTVAVAAYLLGSIPFGYLLVRIFRGQDIRLSGSGNIGATNVVRSGAKGLGIATLILDALKGALAVGLASWFAASKYNDCGDFVAFHCVNTLPFMSTAALFAVLGHMFPVWLKFKGGKGVATALGVFCVLFPKAVLVSLAIFILVVAITRFVSLGSILAAIFFPVAAYFLLKPDAVSLTLSSLIALIVVLKHHQNISRLLAGTENRFGRSKSPIAEKTL
ncbi:MAG TPA: glycerol-3-phosphate 1-O-acyltransferase PlsY, partial [Candidatus Angelobacter sp.]|nr:glycerol-3-phosphate 1-O-acyltransferase PlsY [Candidatus Angelobacter sp.]